MPIVVTFALAILTMLAPSAVAAGPVQKIGPATGDQIHVMTWNLRKEYGADSSPYTWRERKSRVAEVLQVERPTVLGVQEPTAAQLSDIRSMLPGYADVGQTPFYGAPVAPEKGAGYVAVFYDTARLQLVSYVERWLSRTPQEPGSVSWGADQPRMFVRVVFDDRVTGKRFAVVNAHFDHVSELAKRESGRQIAAHVARLAVPAIVLGDFNAAKGTSPAYRKATAGALQGNWKRAAVRTSREFESYHGWNGARLAGKRIDWILTTPEFRADAMAVNPTRWLDWPSDHLPVQGLFTLR